MNSGMYMSAYIQSVTMLNKYIAIVSGGVGQDMSSVTYAEMEYSFKVWLWTLS